MPQNNETQDKHRGSKNPLKSTTESIDFEYLGMDEATKKAIQAMGGDIRVPRSGRSITKGEGDAVKRLYHELDNHKRYDVSILHMKDYGLTDMLEPSIMDKLITKIGKATTIQVLYIQNFPDGMLDPQLEHLTEVLKLGHIWAINIGEASKVTRKGWEKFAEALKDTNMTHMYASENTLLTKELKYKMLGVIRENRKTDKRHYGKSNRHIIDKVTHMWFNPRRSKKYQRQFKPKPTLLEQQQSKESGTEEEKSSSSLSLKKKRKITSSIDSSLKKQSRSEKKNKGIQEYLRAKVANLNAMGQPQSTRKPQLELNVPSSNLLSEKEISKMSFRQQMAYITRQSEHAEVKKKEQA